MIKIQHKGRTGNILLQDVAASIISKKFNLFVENYSKHEDSDSIGLRLYSGNIKNENIKRYDDDNFIELLNRIEDMNSGILLDGYFQINSFVSEFRKEILSNFELKYESRKDQVFVHVRLGDAAKNNPGLKYYQTALNKITFDSGFISSDDPNHPIVDSLIKEYKLELYNDTPLKIINFAKDFEYLILSKGTFSWWMGILSKSKNIYYPINDIGWCGDIFVYEDWKQIDIKSS